MKEDIIAANISGLRSDIQSLAKQIAAWSQSLAQQATPAPQTQIDEKQLAAAIADLIHTDIKSRLQNDKEFVNTVVSAYDRVAKQYSEDINTTHNCLKQNNSYLQLTEKRYKELAATVAAVKRHADPPSIPQTMEAILRFLFITYPWYWVRRIYHSSHFRQYLLLCMSFILMLSVFMTMLVAYDNVRMRRVGNASYYNSNR